jgi:rhamnulokinase
MQRPVDAGTVIGKTRLAEDGRVIRVIAPGSHDTASAVAAAPLTSSDEAFISSGTWSLMGIESPSAYTDDRARAYNFGNEGGVCGRYRVLKNMMGLWLIQKLRKEQGDPSFGEVVAAARSTPAWTTVINPDDPRFLNPSSMTATIETVARENGERVPEGLGALARTVFDSLALAYRHVKEQLETLRGSPLRQIRIIGGGSQNALLNQLCADACQVPVSAGPVETSALGNACLQLMALGAIGSLDEARTLVRHSFPVAEFVPGPAVPEVVWRRFEAAISRTPTGH